MGGTAQLDLEDLLAEGRGPKLGLERDAPGDVAEAQQALPGTWRLSPTFAYAGSLDRHPSVARFDVRDKVCLRVGGFRHGQVVCDKEGHKLIVIGVRCWEGKARLWFQPMDLQRSGVGAFWNPSAAGLRVVASGSPVAAARLEDFDAAEASDSEEVCLCNCCHLPVGEVGYDEEGYLQHGECIAKHLLQELQDKEEVERSSDAASKQECRVKYDIGWSLERMPSNVALATRMLLPPAMQPGLYCVMLHKDGDRVHLAPATEPAAAVNLEYLSIALQVRTKEGREPLFSLDPHRDFAEGNPMQIKRFEPSWLEGTSVGDLLFQADYHLKELSMGEHQQPVLGMRSALELLEDEAQQGMEWNAREWFVVKKAEVFVSDARALIPRVEMGVEARTQVDVCGVLVDSPLTKPDHPLVKYAEAFTHNFDLIAERKSVIFHLRELAKATVLAKFLLESELRVGPALFSAATPSSTKPSMREVPQLWTERKDGQLRVKDGRIFPASGMSVKKRTIYGGVDLTLQRFPRLHYPPVEITGEFEAFPTKLGYIAYADQQEQAAAKAKAAEKGPPPPLTAAFQPPPTAAPARAPARRPPPRDRRQVYRPPQGVDLNLNAFDISATRDVESDHPPGWWGALLQAHARASKAFWQSLEESEEWAGMDAEDQSLLREVFNIHLADRRLEGDRFMLPDTRRSYLQHLRSLVLEEEDVRQLRLRAFLSEGFRASSPGRVFPISWMPSFQLLPADARSCCVHVPSRSDFKDKSIVDSLASAAPSFSRCTEDGMQFRIHRIGALELRTARRHSAEEVVGVAFLDQPLSATPSNHIDECEVVTKVTEYVEQESHKVGWWACFIVLETAAGRQITTRKLPNGTVTWREGAPGSCYQLSAKVLRSCECSAGTCVRDMKILMTREAANVELEQIEAPLESLSYTQRVFAAAVGEVHPSARRRQSCPCAAVEQEKGCRRRQLEKFFTFTASRERRVQERRSRAAA